MDPILQDHLLWDVLSPIFTSVVIAIIGFIIGRLVTQRDKASHALETQQDALKNGVAALLRWELINIHKEYVLVKGYAPREVQDQAEDIYLAYHSLGGNGLGTKLYNEIMALHVEPSRNGGGE